MAKRLLLTFRNTTINKSRTVYIPDPKDDLTDAEAQDLMDAMVGVVFPSDYQKDRAAVVDTEVNELFDLIQ